MKKFSFAVDVVCDEIDSADVVAVLTKALSDELPGDVHANVKAAGIKGFSEQGYKVWRARVTGVTAEQAGDAHDGKVEKEQIETIA